MTVRDFAHISAFNQIRRVMDANRAWQDIVLASTVAAQTAYPLSNIQRPAVNRPVIIDMTGQTTVSITDTGSPNVDQAATVFAIHNHNFPDGTTVRCRLFSAINQGGSTVLDTTALDVVHNVPVGSILAAIDPIEGNFEDEGNYKTHFATYFDSVEYRSFQIDIANASGFTNNLLRFDKGWLGWAYSLEYGPEHGVMADPREDTVHIDKPGGGMESIDGFVNRGLRMSIHLEDYERHVLRHLLDRAKMGGDIHFGIDPNDNRSLAYECNSIYRRRSRNAYEAKHFNGNRHVLELGEN